MHGYIIVIYNNNIIIIIIIIVYSVCTLKTDCYTVASS